MNKRNVQAFIARLKRARAAVERGDTGCDEAPDKCWCCALRKRSGRRGGDNFWRFNGPDSYWSFERPKSDTLAMFDNSIAALETERDRK